MRDLMWPYEVIWAGIRVMLNQKLEYSECALNREMFQM